jgi:hypothetical protein
MGIFKNGEIMAFLVVERLYGFWAWNETIFMAKSIVILPRPELKSSPDLDVDLHHCC